jgi:hypothetical protein
MLSTILLALVLFSVIGGLAAWLGRGATAVVATYVEAKEGVERSKRERAVVETKTATELWNADAASEFEWVSLSAPYARIRGYLISKHGDNIAAYDAWKKAMKDSGDRPVTIITEAIAWEKEQKQTKVKT